MPLPACLLKGHRVQSKRLFIFLGQVAASPRRCRQNATSYGNCGQRWAHTTTQRPHHEALVDNIRNIGIIAHVDAVRGSPLLRARHSRWLIPFPTGQDYYY